MFDEAPGQGFQRMIRKSTKSLLRNTLVIITLLVLVACNGEGLVDGKANLNNCPAAPDNIEIDDIQSVVDWINAMEKPLTLPCFVASLPRPLKTSTSTSAFSAQPARGRRSPRVFFFYNDLIMTVAVDQNQDDDIPAELEKHLLELSFIVDQEKLMTTKAELVFPVTEHLQDDAPYSHIAFSPTLSVCAFCHSGETLHEMIGETPVYSSELLRPSRSIGLSDMIWENANCNPELEPHRCTMLSSIVDHGVMEWVDFPSEAPTLFDK